jgi:ADP-heptose:LPS heptosyltransferase
VIIDPSMEDLLALLAGAAAYLGNDSGPSHLAAALGARTVAVFGPTDLERWAPRGRVRILHASLASLAAERVAAALAENVVEASGDVS